MKFTCKEDGSEWEGKVDNDQPEMMWIERIQPKRECSCNRTQIASKEKSLYERMCNFAGISPYKSGGRPFHLEAAFICREVQALEKRVEELEKNR